MSLFHQSYLMKKLLCAALILFCFKNTLSQQLTNGIFVEAGGPGLISTNLDIHFSKKEQGLGARIGIGDFGLFSSQPFVIPIGLNFLLGRNEKHYFEAGGGVTLVPFIYHRDEDPSYIPTKFDEFRSNFETIYGYISLGYRYQPKIEGLFFRAAITPIISYDFIPYFGGVSLGYKFNQKN